MAPCDHHVGAWLKKKQAAAYGEEVEHKRAEWAESNIGTQQGRQLMLRWLGLAWNELRLRSDMIRSAFTSTGFLMELQQPNALIKMDKVPVYNFLPED